ncbi:MAG TPA: LLM class flavin-dependent oxidoreductase [Stellaceae bacterium]|jgi:alkanesulfonate monooxygenase SsuD/methylene tetrahydromethanopterin reductase-like flavin-dependent oxidoreductase (luciferase family)|nr:LLM class flavin-dependent oxidoreductase [Stellaceae bacterium]
MPVRIGYLLPTREQVMEGRPAAAPMLALAERAEGLGFDSIWVGDSITARPRHEPLTLLSAVAARTRHAELGTAVLLPALRNPVVLAHGIATLDQISEGRFILGVGIASDVPNIRAEFVACGVPFEKRVGRMLEGLRLCRELWSGKPVTWNGRWVMENVTLGPVPHRPGGPPIWIGGMVRASLDRVGRLYDGWFPNAPDPIRWQAQWQEIHGIARDAGRDPGTLTGAVYLTLTIDDDKSRAEDRMNHFISTYYGRPATEMRARQATYAGPAEGAAEWLSSWTRAGVEHMVLRFAGDHQHHLDAISKLRPDIVG